MPTCSQVLIEVHPGDGKPGSCCPHYECRDTEPVCNGTNVTYFRDKCTKCESCNFHAIPCIQFCDPSVVVSNCLTKSNETAVPLGGTWTEDYGCTLCRCTLDGEPDCQATECPRVYCDWPIRREGECCQTCPDEKLVTPTPPHILILQPYSGPTRGPEIETVSSSASPGSFPLIPDILAPFRTTYSDFYELSSSTTEAEVSSDPAEDIASSEAPLQENSSTRDLEMSTDSSTDSSIVSPTDQSTTNGPASTSEASPSTVSDFTAWTSQSPTDTTGSEQKSTFGPKAQTPESTSQVKVPSEEKVSRDARNNTEHRPYISQDRFDTLFIWISSVFGAIFLVFFAWLICKMCRSGKKVNGNYHEVSTQQPQEVCNLKSFDEPSHRK
nr:uncharacterized protein LOC108075334 isoform X2 [Drosophila kikkawai]